MRAFLATALVLSVFGFQAHAEISGGETSNHGSEFFFQPDAGHQDVSLTAGYDSFTTSEDDGSGKTINTTRTGLNPLTARYEYGLIEMLSLGVQLTYETLTQQTDNFSQGSTMNGLQDPQIFAHGRLTLGDIGHLRYGLNVGLGLEAKELDNNGNMNVASGGAFSFIPYVGADFNAGPGLLFARLSYQANTAGIWHSVNVNATVSDANILNVAAGYEWIKGHYLVGGNLDWSYQEPTIIQAHDSGFNYASTLSMPYPFNVNVYARFDLSDSFCLVPKITDTVSAGDVSVKSYNELFVSLEARYTF